MKRTWSLRALILWLSLSPSCFALSEQPEWAMASVFFRGDSVIASFQMTIQEAGTAKVRQLEVFSRVAPGSDRFLARILSPASLTGLKFLRVENANTDAQVWIKTSRTVRRASGASADEKLFGSDFLLSDFVGWTTQTASGERHPELDRPGSTAFVVTLKANPTQQRRLWIDAETHLVQEMAFLDSAGNVVRTYVVDSWAGTGKATYPRLARMMDLVRNTSTTLEVLNLDRTTKIPDSTFSPASL